MPEVEYLDLNKNKIGKVNLPAEIFETEINEYVMHEVVRMQLARRRQGTAKTKERGEVMGGGKKPYRQKGTGRARHGTRRSPLWVGGGTVFGPRPRDYDFKPPAKVRRKALASALSLKFKENRIIVLNDFEIESGKTKEVSSVMNRFELDSALIIDEKGNDKLERGVRNLKGFKYLPPQGLNVYDILKHSHLVLTLKGLNGINSRFA
jgi:large subunit ribosomal protein L4